MNQTTRRHCSIPTRLAIIYCLKKRKTGSVGEVVEEREPLHTGVGMYNGVAAVTLSVSRKVKHRITTGSGNLAPRYMPQRIKNGDSNKYACTHVHKSTRHSG